MAATVPPDVSKALSLGGPAPAGLSPEEQHAWDQLADLCSHCSEYKRRCGSILNFLPSPPGAAAVKSSTSTQIGVDAARPGRIGYNGVRQLRMVRVNHIALLDRA
jgi:hypothetical protein